MRKQTIIFDFDGTLADIKHRRKYLEGDRPDWGEFNALMGDDVPNLPIVALYLTLWNSNQYQILIVTGRNERFRNISEQWLFWNEIPFSQMIMRKDDDNRADHLIKEDILQSLQNDGHDIAFTVDDRQQVVDMWRRNNITCLQCDEGNF